MKTFLALLLLLFVTACSHPLEIKGKGDIVSSNGRHNCLLEEQPCSNIVAGDYNVTYTAAPREGWSFEGWEGCGDQFPDCSFNVPATQVAPYWGQVMPPLRANFSRDAVRNKVLIVMDDSGSMRALMQVGGEKPPYDPNATYADAGFDETKVYWSTDSSKPASDTSRYFAASSNRCESSFHPLAAQGNMTTKAKRWQPAEGSVELVSREVCNGSTFLNVCLPDPPGWEIEISPEWVGVSAGWESLSAGDQTPTHVDCQADALSGQEGNGPNQPLGLPNQPSADDAPDSQAYTTSGYSNVDFGSTTYTWYTAHYLNWFYDSSINSVEKTRLEVEKDAVKSLINTNPSIDFGLATFNDNSDSVTRYTNCGGYYCYVENTEGDNGGRIIHATIENMTAAERTALTGPAGPIDALEHNGWTPLSETMYEVYRYLAGKTPVYGNKRDVSTGAFSLGLDDNIDTPAADPRAYIGGNRDTYQSPNYHCGNTYIILITDGEPSYDTHANAAIEALTGQTCADYPSAEHHDASTKSCLPELTRYMANHDMDGDDSNGNQFGITYTIGLTTEQQLLQDAANNGKGEYFTASSSEELASAFEEIMANISNTPPSACE